MNAGGTNMSQNSRAFSTNYPLVLATIVVLVHFGKLGKTPGFSTMLAFSSLYFLQDMGNHGPPLFTMHTYEIITVDPLRHC
jgi:hypothetical protein